MNKKLGFIAVAALAFVLGSCDKGGNNVLPSKYITISTNIGSLSRVATAEDGSQSFTNGDKISVYAWTGSNTAVGSLVVNNSVNTYNGTAWTASPVMLWKDMVTPHYFIGVYPFRTVTDFTADPYTLDPAKQTDADVLAANVLGKGVSAQEAVGGVVPLNFGHLMSKLVVNLNFRNQWTTTPTVGSVSVPATTTATINYLTMAVTAGTADNMTLPALTTPNAGYALSYSSVVVPQTIKSIVITIEGKTYTYTNSKGINLKQGNIQVVNLIVGRNMIELGSVVIKNWNTGETIDGGEALGD